jgi:hypothetical protein
VGEIRRLLSLAFALVLLLQSGVGAAHCLRWLGPADGLLVEICAAEGKRLTLLDAEGQPAEGRGETGAGVCPACAGLPAVPLPAPPILGEPVLFATAPSFRLVGSAELAPRARAPPYSTRAPPGLA